MVEEYSTRSHFLYLVIVLCFVLYQLSFVCIFNSSVFKRCPEVCAIKIVLLQYTDTMYHSKTNSNINRTSETLILFVTVCDSVHPFH